jgi:2-isopropylmalate synthase
MAVRTRNDAVAFNDNVRTRNLLGLSRMLATITGCDVQPNKAIVGRNAFAHEAGIHQDGMQKHAGTYEIMRLENIGWEKSSLVLGKHSGRAAFRDKLKTLGYVIGDNQLNDAFGRFKELADRSKVVFDEDLIRLIDDAVMCGHERLIFVSLNLHGGSRHKARAELALHVDGAIRSATATGNGPMDATCNAIRSIVPHDARLVLLSVAAVIAGTDGQARTTVRLEAAGRTVDGQGADADLFVSAALAYVQALNKLPAAHLAPEPAPVLLQTPDRSPPLRKGLVLHCP